MYPTPEGQHRRARDRYWLHALLFVLTLLSTTAVGARLTFEFHQNRPTLVEDDLLGIFRLLSDFPYLVSGLPFSFTLLTILFAHEMGHYLACRYYGIDASLPYFIPAPTLIGTFGAFIRIRSSIYSRAQLFDIGVAGPIAGFVFVLPALAIGLAYSKVIPGIAMQGDLIFGTPLILRVMEMWVFPGAAAADILLHPIARAGWVGVLATALNLMPIGQLDGGHILYSAAGEFRHRLLTRLMIAALILLGFFVAWSWLVWAVLILLFGRRHPRIYDETGLGPGRVRLALLALVIFVCSFSIDPIELAPIRANSL